MPSIILPSRFYSQPQGAVEVDWANPLADGLVLALLPWQEAVSQAIPTFLGPAGLLPTKAGVAHQGGLSSLVGASLPRTLGSKVSILAVGGVQREAGTAVNITLCNESGDSMFGSQFSTTTSALGRIVQRRTDGGAATTANFTPPQTISQFDHAVWGGTSDDADVVRTYWDGEANATAALSTGTNSVFSRFSIGGAWRSTISYMGAGNHMAFGAVWDNRVLGADDYRALADNPWQLFKPRKRVLYFDVASGGAALEGAAAAQAAASAALSVSVPLAGASVAVATATGALAVSIPLAGAATATASASGGLSLSIPLAGASVAQALAAAGITQGVPLAGDASALAAAAAGLSINVSLSGVAIATAAAATGLTVVTSGLAGDALASASASGNLTHGVPLTGDALTVASASGNLTQIVPLSGSAASASMATGGLDVSVQLSAAALAEALATAGLTVDGGMSGAAAAEATASGSVTLRVNLDGAAVAQAIAAGALTTAGLIVAGTPGYRVTRTPRTWRVTRTPRTWRITA